MNLYKMPYCGLGTLSIILLGLIFTWSVNGRPAPSDEPVILIGGLGATILSEKDPPRFCNSAGYKNDKQFIKYLYQTIFDNPQNLAFNNTGEADEGTLSKKLKPVGFLRIPGRFNDICDLSFYLQNNNYKAGENLFEFFYDFRYSVKHNAEELTKFVADHKITGRHADNKFNIVAHSLGGLIAKQFLKDQSDQAKVDKLILVDTPNSGSIWALVALRYGLLPLHLPFIKGCNIKKAFHNAPSFFNLLPGEKYFSKQNSYLKQNGYIVEKDSLLSFNETLKFLKTKSDICLENKDISLEKLDSKLLADQFEEFSKERDNWQKPDNVKVYALSGYGLKTIQTLEEENGAKIKFCRMTAGDTIVPFWSTELDGATQNYYIDLKNKIKTDHLAMIGNKKIDQGILSLLQHGATDDVISLGFSTEPPKIKDLKICHEVK